MSPVSRRDDRHLTEPCQLGQHSKCRGATTIRLITGGPCDGEESLPCTCPCHKRGRR